MQHATRSSMPWLICLLAALVVTGCSSFEPVAQAMVLPSPSSPSPLPTQAATSSPPPPTPTAVVFELQPSSTPAPTFTPQPTVFQYAYGPAGFPADINPLTGLPVADVSRLERRVLAVKITNFPRSVRPQWGLSLADNVFEYYLEDGMTRFIGLFYGTDAERVGPVRSARFFDEHVVRMYKAVFTFGSADPRVLDPWLHSDLKNFLILERPSNCPPLCRIGPKDGYNTLFLNTGQLSEYITERGTNNARQNLDGLRFELNSPYSGQAGAHIFTEYSPVSYNRWDYDPVSARYLRFSDTVDALKVEKAYAPLTDSLTGEQIATDNLVVLLVPHEYYVYTKTTEMVKMNFFGDGKAYAFREGKAYPIRWKRESPENLLSLVYLTGQPFPLKPGKVFFQVIGAASPVAQPAESEWQFGFTIPPMATPTPTVLP